VTGEKELLSQLQIRTRKKQSWRPNATKEWREVTWRKK